jgi:hypothetical protein
VTAPDGPAGGQLADVVLIGIVVLAFFAVSFAVGVLMWGHLALAERPRPSR